MDKDSMQLSFNEENSQADNGPVVCLGMTFKNDEERREYFREELRKKLPELKKIEGFPIGEDEDIIALSDPPYYTACPNPWLNDFIEVWEKEKVTKYGRDLDEEYHREPFAADVSEGKNDPIYIAHSYHTKVPPKAITRYILHYTKPGDIVFDGFCGTGMTGVAAHLCNDKKTLRELGFKVTELGDIEDKEGHIISKLGTRKSIMIDLSPAATHIASNYNSYQNENTVLNEARSILEEVRELYSWMYETNHETDIGEQIKGKINYVVWSDVFSCPTCGNEINYYDVAVDLENKKINDKFTCSNCNAIVSKKTMERTMLTIYDDILDKSVRMVKQVPVLINYSIGKQRYNKQPDQDDLITLEKINKLNLDKDFSKRMPVGEESRRNDKIGLLYSHQFFYKRTYIILSEFVKRISNKKNLWIITAVTEGASKLNRERPFGLPSKLSGTLYVSSMIREINVLDFIERKIKKYISKGKGPDTIISNQSSTEISLRDESVDYIFIDPPFGANLMYSELNFLWENWLKVFTNNNKEAIVNKEQKKSIEDYKFLIYNSIKEAYRILKPGHWMTVEFSNSQASVWNAIQESIQKAGFVIANVSVLDKKQGSFKAVTTTTAVKQDLVISAYKPKQENIEKIKKQQNTEESAWSFVTQHLEQLPKFLGTKGEAEVIPERTPRILFDRMVAYHVQNGLSVPISSAEFQAGVAHRFPMRDGMVFLESQVAEYDKKRTLVKEFTQLSLFISDENSAIEWIRQQLIKKPQTRQDIHPNFMKELQHIAKHELLPELDDLLNQNFLRYDGEGPVPNQILTYLRRTYKDLRGLEPTDPKVVEKAMHRWYVPDPNKQADLEKLREKALLREYESYLQELEGNKKKLRTFRTEAIRAGFKKAYSEKDFESIVKVGERIPEKVIQEDDKLLMYYDNACIRLGL
ncbi:MAG: site-specific DNA-methyltransferase [Bacteroidales bacterium]|nr:site-specific DNA-methyltransferase [Bacteroidales bacterium]